MKIAKRILIGLLILLVLVMAGWTLQYTHKSDPDAVQTYQTTNPYITPGQVQVSAHRSGGGIMPEETMMAFRNCVESGDFDVDWIEFDLHITADGVLVLLHDDDLDRTSDSETVFGEKDVAVSSKTLAELKQLNMGAKFEAEDGSYPYANATGSDLDDLRIVTLDEALDYLTSRGDYGFIIEIKNEGELGTRTADLLHQNLSSRGLLDRAIVGSFHDDVSAYVEATYPDIIRTAGTSEVIDFAKAGILGDTSYTPSYDILVIPYGDLSDNYGVNLGTARFINYAHERNIAVFYWTINDTDQMEYLTSIYADCLITDYPDKASAYRTSR